MTVKPFSTYPEDHDRLLKLADKILSEKTDHDDALAAAVELADLVQAIVLDEEHYEPETTTTDLLAALCALLSDVEAGDATFGSIIDARAAIKRATEG